MRKGTLEELKQFQEELIAKAERADELEKENARLEIRVNNLEFEIAAERQNFRKNRMQNKRYREVINELRDFVKRGEDECNIKQLIMVRTSEYLEGEE